ncbi:MAG: hypothetical protein NTW21_10050 [Verrucomicrobia bacterium]|nr:hypothetical protein [Verrucomicrobiota bacterium]
MTRFIQHYGILVLSLLTLFASGLCIGRLTARRPQPAMLPALDTPAGPESWVAAASRGLVRDLHLDEAQELQVRQQLEPVALAIFTDQERVLFQMHLRLLELHDTLAKADSLDQDQLERLVVSRAKLRELIIRKFPLRVRDNPALAIGNESK